MPKIISQGELNKKYLKLSLAKENYALATICVKNLFSHTGKVGCEAKAQNGAAQAILKNLLPNEYCAKMHPKGFIILFKALANNNICQKITKIINTAYGYTNIDFSPTGISLGIGVIPLNGARLSLSTAVYLAELSRKGSKQHGYCSSHFEIYGVSFLHSSQNFWSLQDKVLPALKNGEFKVYLQPKVCLKTGQINSAEALIRWINPEKGNIPLSHFLGGIEENGLIRQADLYLLSLVCISLEKWLANYSKSPCISVNLSAAYFEDEDFVADYMNVIKNYKLLPNQLEIEFVEKIVAEKTEKIIDLATQLKGYGLGCSVDDFGSGYSAFNLIANMPLNSLKIDRSLFANWKNPKEQLVLKHIIALAHELNIKAVAEGIETADYVKILKKMDCDYIQGYVFYKPMPLKEFEERFIIAGEKIDLAKYE